MKFAAVAASVCVLSGCVALMRADSGEACFTREAAWSCFGLSLAMANVAIRVASQAHWPSGTRFRLAVAG